MIHLLLVALLTLTGCYSIGNADIKSKDLIAQVQIGKSSKADVQRLLGEPYGVSRGKLPEARPGDASYGMTMDEWWMYFYSKYETGATSFIPYVGWLVGQKKEEYSHFAVGFDGKGIV
jgi:hypothetical protein